MWAAPLPEKAPATNARVAGGACNSATETCPTAMRRATYRRAAVSKALRCAGRQNR
jgi:hypothetical protein